jgi:membrane fusion protein, multidrug efflux system
MKKLVIILLATSVLVSCGSKSSELDKLKSDLEEKKEELSTLRVDIKKIEAEIEELDSNKKEHLVAVRATAIQRAEFKNPVKLQGLVESNQDVVISSELGGKVLSIHVKEGQKVTKGQLLARLDGSAMRNQVGELEAALELAEVAYNKQKSLWDQKIGSEIQFLQAKNQYDRLKKSLAAAKANLSKFTLTSPITGNVDEVFTNTGQILAPGMSPVMRIVNNNNVTIKANVSEKYLTKLAVGDDVIVTYPSLEVSDAEKIASIGSFINPNNRTFNVVITPSHKSKFMRPNLLAIITAYDYKMENVVTVPTKLVRGEEGKKFVLTIVKGSDNVYVVKKQPVVIERAFIDRTVIESGLDNGALIITEGYNKVVNKDRVKLLD